MPPEHLQHHTCGYYCTGTRHAVECIAKADLPAETVAHGYAQYTEPHGWRVVDVRPAPEADVEAWRGQMAWGYDPRTGEIRQHDIPTGAVVGWLVFLEPIPEGMP